MNKVYMIAEMCHEVNRLWCIQNGDLTQTPWNEAAQWQKEAAITGVEFHLENPDAPVSATHEAWLADKIEAGWTYGDVKDPVKKTHPCLLPYHELPEFEQKKDALFSAIVRALSLENGFIS